jgi:rod shape-determining protein MreC
MNSTTSRTLQSFVLGLIVVGLLALALGGYLAPLSRLLVTPAVSAQTWLSTRYQAVVNLVSAPQDLARLRQRNNELEAQVSRLESEIIELQQQLGETNILSALVDFARVHPENQYLAAAVIGRDPSPFLQYIIINRGSDDGLRRGMPIVTAQGLVGRISAVTAGAARVQLITDPGSQVNSRLQKAEVEGVLHGAVTGEITLEMIPPSAKVENGDLVLTSGLGGNFPSNILIGQVTGVRTRAYDIFQTASIQPVVDFSKLEIVLVITNFRPVDIAPLIPTPSAP